MNEPTDDLMALADAVGVTPASRPVATRDGAHDDVPFHPHPSHHHEFTDPALDAVVSRWASRNADEEQR